MHWQSRQWHQSGWTGPKRAPRDPRLGKFLWTSGGMPSRIATSGAFRSISKTLFAPTKNCDQLELRRVGFLSSKRLNPLTATITSLNCPTLYRGERLRVALSLTSQQLERRENVSLCEDRFTAGFADEIPSSKETLEETQGITCDGRTNILS